MVSMVGKSIRKWWALFTLPTLAAFIVGFLAPFAIGVYLSFCEFTTVSDAKFRRFQKLHKNIRRRNLPALFMVHRRIHHSHNHHHQRSFIRSGLHAYQSVPRSNVFRSIFFMPNLIGGIILGYIWQLLLNGVLAHWSKSITYSETYGFWGLVILLCWQQIGYMMIIYIAGLQSLPSDVMEAAQVDGANPRQTLFHVTIPLMMPSITVCTFLTVTNGFKLFDQNLALTNGAPSRASEMLALNIYTTFYGRTGYEASARPRRSSSS